VHKVQRRIGIQQTTTIPRTGGTNRTLGEVKNIVENDTTRGMASSLHTYFKGNTSKLVHRPGIVQRKYNMEDVAIELHNHFLIRA
jgi:hypothetical protein